MAALSQLAGQQPHRSSCEPTPSAGKGTCQPSLPLLRTSALRHSLSCHCQLQRERSASLPPRQPISSGRTAARLLPLHVSPWLVHSAAAASLVPPAALALVLQGKMHRCLAEPASALRSQLPLPVRCTRLQAPTAPAAALLLEQLHLQAAMATQPVAVAMALALQPAM